MAFPDGFLWGAAAAAFQVEGAADADGRGESIWDVFARRPGATFAGGTPAVACDHYHRWAEDVDLMRRIGLNAYRMSLSWSRVRPEGTGAPNPAGWDFYERLIDGLLAAGVEPMVSLYHWDLPQALQRRGGWMNRAVAGWFADYAAQAVERLGDRVTWWETVNEPQVFIELGYRTGEHAPGLTHGFGEVVQAMHHVLLAHGRGVQALRAGARRPVKVGFASTGTIRIPASAGAADVEAARGDMFAVTDRSLWKPSWFLDPIFRGAYPADGLALFGADGPRVEPGDLETIRQPVDYLGFNCYTADTVRAGADGRAEGLPHPQGVPRSLFDWPLTPAILYWGPRFLAERYGKPVVITENGFAGTDWVHLDGRVHDPQRIDFHHRYLRELKRAADEGVPLAGYFVWTLMDNFECQHGYRMRMGLIHTDFDTQRRTLKDSADWYRRVIETNGECLGTR